MADTGPLERASHSDDAKPAAPTRYSFVQLLTYGTVAIGASWGLMEILLVTDPFRATWFKSAWIIGVAALTVAVALPALFVRLGVSTSALACIAAIAGAAAIAVGLGQNPLANALGLSAVIDTNSWLRTPLIVFGVSALVVALAMIIPSRVTRSVRTHATPPVVFAAAAMGVFAFLISTGRANDIERRDIALEELRQAGMLYSMESLQNTLFFMNERGLRLYREAGFQYDDVLYALGQPSAFSGTQPMLFAILDRAEQQDTRIERFVATMTSARLNPRGMAGSSSELNEPFPVYRVEGTAAPRVRGDGARPLLSYAIERRAPGIVASLLRDGAQPLYSADIGMAPEPTFAIGPTDDDYLSASDAHHLHTQAVLDPLLALGSSAWRIDDAAATALADDALADPSSHVEALCAVAAAMNDAHGVAPLDFVRRDIVQFAKDWRIALSPTCEALLADDRQDNGSATKAAEHAPTAVTPFELRSGYMVQTGSKQTCSLSPVTLSSGGNRTEFVPGPRAHGSLASNQGASGAGFLSFHRGGAAHDNEGDGLWFIGLEGEVAGEDVVGALQVQRHGGQDHQRAIFGRAGALRTAGWTEAVTDSNAAFAAAQQGHMLVVLSDEEADASSVTTPQPVRPDEAPIALAIASDESGGDDQTATSVDSHVFRSALSVERPALQEAVRLTGETANVSLEVDQAGVDLCLEIAKNDVDGVHPLVSRFIPAGARDRSVIANAKSDDELFARVYLAEPASIEEASFIVKATPPRLSCDSSESARAAGGATSWVPGARVDDELAPTTDVWCRVDVEEASTVSLVLDNLAGDLDLALFAGGETPDEDVEIASSVAAGSAPESLQAYTEPGTYYIRVWSLANVVSPFSLYVESVVEQGDLDDPYEPNSADTAYDLGVIAVDGDGADITDVAFPDGSQFFSVSIEDAVGLNVLLHNMSADLDLTVYDASGDAIGSSANGSSDDDQVLAAVGPGVYTIEVAPYFSTGFSPYALTITGGDPEDAQVGGFELFELGDLEAGAPLRHEGVLAVGSQVAAHSFTLNEAATLVITLSGLTVDADLYLLDGAGDRLAYSDLGGSDDERVEADVEPGNYVARVDLFDSEETPYVVEISIDE